MLIELPFGGVRGNVRTPSIARWKAHGYVVDFLFVIIERFSLSLTAETL